MDGFIVIKGTSSSSRHDEIKGQFSGTRDTTTSTDRNQQSNYKYKQNRTTGYAPSCINNVHRNQVTSFA